MKFARSNVHYRPLAVRLSLVTLGLIEAVAPASALTHSGPIKVNLCSPAANVSAGPPAFVPGYYPSSRWFWNDAYGYRYYQRPVTANPTLSIDYVNVSQQPLKSIEFGLVARGQLVAEVRDVGTFSPGIEIKHQFGLDPNVFPLGTALPVCVPLRAHYADGTKWKNPRLPALRRALYGAP